MTQASYVPPTAGTDGSVGDALRATPFRQLLQQSFVRFRSADGASFATATAFGAVLTIIPGMIFFVALAARLGPGRTQDLIREAITTMAPGPAGDVFLTAFQQGSEAGTGALIAAIAGGVTAFGSGVFAATQIQSGASRIYGVREDRPILRRYGLAAALTLSFGIFTALALVVLVFGATFSGALSDEVASTWAWARWPIGVVALGIGLAIVFKVAPNRPHPSYRWLSFGVLVAALAWLGVSGLLALYLTGSSGFGETYGPLAGFIGVMLWARFSAVAIFLGMAVAAQLEARRAGVSSPIVANNHA